LLQTLEEVPDSVKDLLKMSRGTMEMFQSTQKRLVQSLLENPSLGRRVERLVTIPGVGPITALTWALEIAYPHRFSSSGNAMSYCGLASALRSSAGKQQRRPISKQRNPWAANRVDRGCQAGSALEPATGCRARARWNADIAIKPRFRLRASWWPTCSPSTKAANPFSCAGPQRCRRPRPEFS